MRKGFVVVALGLAARAPPVAALADRGAMMAAAATAAAKIVGAAFSIPRTGMEFFFLVPVPMAATGIVMPGWSWAGNQSSMASWGPPSIAFRGAPSTAPRLRFSGLRLTSTPPIIAKPMILTRGAPGVPGPVAL